MVCKDGGRHKFKANGCRYCVCLKCGYDQRKEYQQYNLCLKIANELHLFQRRKYSNEPYVNHPIRMSRKLDGNGLKCIALLHDVLEDTKATKTDLLKQGVTKEVVKIIDILTRKKNETYFDFIMRIKKNQVATAVKIEDITDNLRDLEEGSLKDKYRFARFILKEKQNGNKKFNL